MVDAMNPTVDILRAIFSLAFVVGVMWLIGYVIKKYGHRWGLPQHMTVGRNRRLKLVEVLSVDHKTKIALIRHDDKEHLLVVGAEGSQIIEKNLPSPPDTA